MKKIVLICCILFTGYCGFTQVSTDPELLPKLDGKTKFSDIKQTVLDHYTAKLRALDPMDSTGRKKIMRALKMWNRQFWLGEYYVDDNGEMFNANALIYGTYEKLKASLPKTSNRSQPINWIHQGPNSIDFSTYHGEGIGRVDVIEFYPGNPNIIFAGSANGGLFKSINGGTSWTSISGFIPSLGISGIAIDNTNPNIMYILTGDANSGGGCFTGNAGCAVFGENISASVGVLKTYDGGVNWFQTGFISNTVYSGHRLIIDPSNPNILLAATSIGIYRTEDAGNIWNRVSTTNNYWDLEFNPGNSSIVYAAADSVFQKSIDNGLSFLTIPINNLINTTTRISVAVTPANPNRVVLLAGMNVAFAGTLVGIFSSPDAGETFTRLYNDNNHNLFSNYIDINVTSCQVNYNNTIAISPLNENVILVGGLCIWSSHDGGWSWRQETAYWAPSSVLDDYAHPDTHVVTFSPPGTLYAANDGGVYRGDPDGSEWDWPFISNGLSATQFYHFERQNDEDVIWGGAQDNGILQQNTGTNYSIFYGGDGYDEMTDRDYLVADGDNNDVFFSVNNSIRKDCANGTCDIGIPNNIEFFANLAMSPDLEDKIYAGYQSSVYISYNAGSDWTSLGTVPGNWCISTCPSNTNVIYAAGTNASNGGGIRKWQSPNTWTNLTPFISELGYDPDVKISDIDVNPSNENIVYISVAGNNPSVKVFKTTDGGFNWTNLASNKLPNVPAMSVKCDQNNGVYVGTSIGVFYKRDNVNYWEYFSNGLPPAPVTEIELWFNTEVWISTFGRGIWNTSQYAPCPANISLTGDVSGSYYKEASNEITSTQLIQGGIGTDVKYNKGNIIRLLPGFKATFGCKFHTYSSGCGGETD